MDDARGLKPVEDSRDPRLRMERIFSLVSSVESESATGGVRLAMTSASRLPSSCAMCCVSSRALASRDC